MYNRLMNYKTAYYKLDDGFLKITYDKKINRIDLVDEKDSADQKSELTDLVAKEIKAYLKEEIRAFSFYESLKPIGTSFQKEVWQALLTIPYGKTITYKEMARLIGREKAVRAVAAAIGKNPCWLVIPCHRVIGSNGKLTGYAYGLSLKEKLLSLEKANLANK